jgi:hypothetical protein
MGLSLRQLLKRPIALGAVVVLAAGGTVGGLLITNSSASAASSSSSPHATIEVTGTGAATGTPDTVTIQIAVSTTASSATTALDQNNSEMKTLEDVLISSGASLSDLQTSNLNLSPNYGAGGAVTNYGAQDDLTVTLHDVGASGVVIDAAAHAVGNDVQIQGISFSISNTSALLKAARLQAMQNAGTEASDLALSAGTSLGAITKITDQEQSVAPPPREFAANLPTAAASAVPVQSGSEQISVQVDVVYSLGS